MPYTIGVVILYLIAYIAVIFLSFIFFPGQGKDYWNNENIVEEMPSCRQMFNIFHPFDPVAYRYL